MFTNSKTNLIWFRFVIVNIGKLDCIIYKVGIPAIESEILIIKDLPDY